jgi:hypothetical protein
MSDYEFHSQIFRHKKTHAYINFTLLLLFRNALRQEMTSDILHEKAK